MHHSPYKAKINCERLHTAARKDGFKISTTLTEDIKGDGPMD
jgi:hypothetical protein